MFGMTGVTLLPVLGVAGMALLSVLGVAGMALLLMMLGMARVRIGRGRGLGCRRRGDDERDRANERLHVLFSND